MIRLHDALSGVIQLGFDTSPVIYFVEAHPQYDVLMTDVFQRIDNGTLQGFAPVITLAEVLIQPLRSGDATLQQEYRDLLLHTSNFHLIPIGITITERAADLRARYNLRMPDALQIAAALNAGCQAFLTNDTVLQRVTELRVLVLDELEL